MIIREEEEVFTDAVLATLCTVCNAIRLIRNSIRVTELTTLRATFNTLSLSREMVSL